MGEELLEEDMEKQALQCKLYIGRKQYLELSKEGKAFFDIEDNGDIVATVPLIQDEGITLSDCVRSLVEVAYLEGNPKYAIAEDTVITSEMYKLGKTDEVFNLLVTIHYANEKKPFQELLLFEQRELTDTTFSFALLGDQTMFQIQEM